MAGFCFLRFFFSLSFFFRVHIVKPLSDDDFVWFLGSPGAAAAGSDLVHLNPWFCGPACALCVCCLQSMKEKSQNSAGVADILRNLFKCEDQLEGRNTVA